MYGVHVHIREPFVIQSGSYFQHSEILMREGERVPTGFMTV